MSKRAHQVHHHGMPGYCGDHTHHDVHYQQFLRSECSSWEEKFEQKIRLYKEKQAEDGVEEERDGGEYGIP